MSPKRVGESMPSALANGIELDYVIEGPAAGPAIVLIMGLSSQRIFWPPRFLSMLHDAGYRTVCFDNRDIGQSQKIEGKRVPNLLVQGMLRQIGVRGLSPYSLEDMAKDTTGLMDALGLERAHVVGLSMGGMIGQIVSATMPERVSSFTAIMTSTNHPSLPRPSEEILAALTAPRNPSPAIAIEQSMQLLSLIGTKGAKDHDEMRARVTEAFRRGGSPAGPARQIAAIIDTGHLRRHARRISVPTLVMHGSADPLISVQGGMDVARHVPNARLEVIEGMGHDLPDIHLAELAGHLIGHARTADGMSVH